MDGAQGLIRIHFSLWLRCLLKKLWQSCSTGVIRRRDCSLAANFLPRSKAQDCLSLVGKRPKGSSLASRGTSMGTLWLWCQRLLWPWRSGRGFWGLHHDYWHFNWMRRLTLIQFRSLIFSQWDYTWRGQVLVIFDLNQICWRILINQKVYRWLLREMVLRPPKFCTREHCVEAAQCWLPLDCCN